MKELSIEEKAKRYELALERCRKLYNEAKANEYNSDIEDYEAIFPELKESEDEKTRKALISFLKSPFIKDNICDWKVAPWIAWLEKQAEQKSIMNVPSREVILSIWDLGNEWKELTGGSISTEYGTQLDYIQKHWQESEYYLRAKQGEQKPIVIIPKFRVGDNIKTTNEEPLTITKIDDKGYWSEDLFICGFDDTAKWELVEQKPAWSCEDETRLQACLDTLQANSLMGKVDTVMTKWLKSLKNRIKGD